MNDSGLALPVWEKWGLVPLASRLILGGLFIFLGTNKAQDPVLFLKLIREYQMVPESASFALNSIAIVLPWLEILCGVLVIIGVGLRGTALLMSVMLIGFSLLVAMRTVGIHNAQEIAFCAIKFDCGCGAGEVLICKKLLENFGLVLLSVLILLSRSRKLCLRAQLIPSKHT